MNPITIQVKHPDTFHLLIKNNYIRFNGKKINWKEISQLNYVEKVNQSFLVIQWKEGDIFIPFFLIEDKIQALCNHLLKRNYPVLIANKLRKRVGVQNQFKFRKIKRRKRKKFVQK